jgi:hypothetical protein
MKKKGGRGGKHRTLPGAARHRPERRSCVCASPLPRAGAQLAVCASAGGLPLLGAHARLSAGVTRRTPTLCGNTSWTSSSLCPSQTVCGFPAVWVVCRGVLCGLCLVNGGLAGAGAGGGGGAVGDCLRSGASLVDVRLDVVPLPTRSSSPTVVGCRLGGYPAGRDRWGEEFVVGGVLPRITLTQTPCGVNQASSVYQHWCSSTLH